MDAGAAPVTLFYSYAHEDETLRDELQGHLKLLERRGLLAPWHDRKIVPGADWSGAIDSYLRSAELVLLLVSKDFIESDYIMGTELAVAMQRHAAQAAVVVPIVVRAVDFDPQDEQELPFLRLQGLPTDLRPVTSWPNRDEAWTNVAKGLRATVKQIREGRPEASSDAVEATFSSQAAPSEIRVDAAPLPAPVTAANPGGPPLPLPLPANRGPVGNVFDWINERVETLQIRRIRLPAPAPSTKLSNRVPATPADPLLDRIVTDVSQQIAQAQRERGALPLSAHGAALLHAQTRALIDLPEQHRVLWVDDRPQGNRFEAAALAKLQIEIVTARSTDEALQRIAADTEGFALVISDWERAGEPAAEDGSAGLHLLARLRDAGLHCPLIFYHGAQGEQREARAAQARDAGALGEAVLPDELMTLVLRALQAEPAAVSALSPFPSPPGRGSG